MKEGGLLVQASNPPSFMLFLHLFCYPEHPRVDVVGKLFWIRQGYDDIGLVARASFAACLLKFGIHCHGVG